MKIDDRGHVHYAANYLDPESHDQPNYFGTDLEFVVLHQETLLRPDTECDQFHVQRL